MGGGLGDVARQSRDTCQCLGLLGLGGGGSVRVENPNPDLPRQNEGCRSLAVSSGAPQCHIGQHTYRLGHLKLSGLSQSLLCGAMHTAHYPYTTITITDHRSPSEQPATPLLTNRLARALYPDGPRTQAGGSRLAASD